MGDSAETSEVKGFDSYPVQLGDLMRGERATLGKSLLDVQRDIRIKAAYIAAIENCDSTAFQTPGFIAGYVRSYARYLGLDAEAIFTQFCAEAGFDGVHPGISAPAKKPSVVTPIRLSATSRRLDDPLSNPRAPYIPAGDGIFGQFSPSAMGSIVVLLVLILAIGYGAWSVLQDFQRVEFVPVDQSPALAAGGPVVDGAGSVTVGSTQDSKAATLSQLYRPKGLDVPIMTPRDGPIAALDPDNIGALIANNGGRNARETAAMLAKSNPRVTEVAAPLVAIVASRPAWIRVSLADGKVLFERILDGGESFQLPAGTATTVLRAGNSGAVYVTLDGVPYGPVGTGTTVVKQVALGPENILESFAIVNDTTALAALDSPRVITLNSSGTGN